MEILNPFGKFMEVESRMNYVKMSGGFPFSRRLLFGWLAASRFKSTASRTKMTFGNSYTFYR